MHTVIFVHCGQAYNSGCGMNKILQQASKYIWMASQKQSAYLLMVKIVVDFCTSCFFYNSVRCFAERHVQMTLLYPAYFAKLPRQKVIFMELWKITFDAGFL